MFKAFRAAFQVPELRQKLIITVVLLAIFTLGSQIPNPGVNSAALEQATKNGAASGLLNILGIISGGNLSRFSIFALGVLPYITASIIMQISTTAIPALEKLQKEGEEGRKKINQYTRYAALILGAFQSILFSSVLVDGSLMRPGWGENMLLFRIVVLITQVAGIAFTIWIGERITEFGIGNGVSLIIFAGIVTRFPAEIQQTIQLVNAGQVQPIAAFGFIVFIVLVIAAIVFIQQGERRIPVQYARKVVGRTVYGGQATYIPLKINTAGVIPIIFASAIFALPRIVLLPFGNQPWVQSVTNFLSFGTTSGLIVEVILIIAFTYFYTTIAFDPKKVSDSLREYGGFIPSVRPGAPTQHYLEKISYRIALWGAIFLGLLAIMPNIFQKLTNITSFQLGGTTLLIVVGVALDTLKQIESQLTVRSYEGFIKRGRIRGRSGDQ